MDSWDRQSIYFTSIVVFGFIVFCLVLAVSSYEERKLKSSVQTECIKTGGQSFIAKSDDPVCLRKN